MPRIHPVAPLLGAALLAACGLSHAASHREAPFITTVPKVDATDFYLFRSYEPGRADYVTLIANYQPLQDTYGGPNYFAMDPTALYKIHVDTRGTARVPERRIEQLIREHFDLRPKGIIQMLDLLRPIYRKTAAYGHFGRDEPEFTWEHTDKAQALRAAAGL